MFMVIKDKHMAKRTNGTKKKLLIGGAAVVVLAGLLFALESFKVTHLFSAQEKTTTEDAKTTSTAPTAQDDFSDGGPRDVNENTNNEGTVQDTGGNVSNIPPQSQWSVSGDQKITVYSPAKDGLVKDGGAISGASNLSKVYFRLIDDVSGV